jgi:hypothetical protein
VHPWRVAAAAPAFLLGCATPPVDPFAPAADEYERGRLLRALVLLDCVPPANQHYAEARTLASALERRMRVAQEMVLRGLSLRCEWRDIEAVDCFQRAQIVWPEVPGAADLLQATKNRIAALSRGVQQQVLPEVITMTIESQAVHAAPLAEMAPLPPQDETDDLLERGDLDGAVEQIQLRMARNPDEAGLKRKLGQALHQRALSRYGLGFLEAAITDWSGVLNLNPQNAQARAFLHAARAELESRRRAE